MRRILATELPPNVSYLENSSVDLLGASTVLIMAHNVTLTCNAPPKQRLARTETAGV
jgi:hypothetical protein